MSIDPGQVKSIFLSVVDQPVDQRNHYLDQACKDNHPLRQRIEALLVAHLGEDRLFDEPDVALVIPDILPDLKEGPGSVIGRYKLLEKIGEGGMAVVYMAQQERPIRRKVALKIIKVGMDTRQVIARFEAERQALALMDHPHTAKVLDAGATETGRPYFVMELVRGGTITEYCDRNKLSTKARLDLFIQVCQAVQHAHQKGIIHRDIKPSNVMVTQRNGSPIPKVIDFGIAKATNQRLTEKTLFTRYAQIIGTPAYMSPEQAEFGELDIDTRTDIYSLGILLYELLTGSTPFSEVQLRKAGYLEMQRVIREEEPTKPSTKLSALGATLTEIAQHRSVAPETLRRLIQGDLDWIAMKSLDKDRSRRYDTAGALALDIQRHLDHEPVAARAPKLMYRLHKFLRRHRIQVAAVLTLAVLIGAMVMTFTVWNRSRDRFSAAESLIHERILSQANESFVRGDYEAALKHAESVAGSKQLGSKARLLCASILVDWGEPNKATPMLEDLLDERPEIAGVAHLLMARVILESESSDSQRFEKIAEHQRQADKLLPESADAYFQRAMTAVAIREKLGFLDRALQLDRGHYESRRLRAYTFYASKKYKEMKEDASAMTVIQKDDPLGYSLHALALRELGSYDEAIAEYDYAIELTSEDTQRTKLHEQRCDTYLRMREFEQAIAGAREGLKGSADATVLHFRMFCALTALGDYEKASALFHQVTDANQAAKRNFRDWSKKYVFDTLEAGRPWYHPNRIPKSAAFLSMLEAVDIHHNLVTKGAQRLTTDGYTSQWSPDRTKLAFSMGVHGYSGLAVFDPNSRETELLMVPGSGPKWSPDGRYIAFSRDCQMLSLSEYTAVERKRHFLGNREREIWIIRADGTEPRRLGRGWGPSWSQDSKQVCYRSDGVFYTFSIEDEEAQPQPNYPMTQGSPSPNHKKIADVKHGCLTILDPTAQAPLAQWTGPLRIWGGNWSPDSNEFSLGGFRNPEERTGLWIYDLNTQEALKVLSGHIINATWALDRTALTFCLGPPFYEVWGVDLDPNLSTVESLGPGRTRAQHYQEMVDLYTGRIEADPGDVDSYVHRSTYYHYLHEKGKALADIQTYVDISYPENAANSRNTWLKHLLTELYQKPPANPGPPVNGPAWDCPGSLSADGLKLYFHSWRTGGFGARDLYIAQRAGKNDPWGEPENLGDDINTDANDYEADISEDELTLLFVSDRPGGSGRDDIWMTKRVSIDDPWGPPVNLGPTINSSASDMDPSTTADGLTLYFSSRRTGGMGTCNIWVSNRATSDDPWGKPVSLGEPVNSSGFNSCPDVSADGLALFFLSMRWGGLGQADLFVSTRPSIHEPWGPAVNLGPNINTHQVEEYPKISLDGTVFMFVPNRLEGIGLLDLDIWQVDIGSVKME